MFLYLALAAPHTPWLPTGRFDGISRSNVYSDFVAQVDGSVGQVLAALDRMGVADNTLVFFSSDNGPVWYALIHPAGLYGIRCGKWKLIVGLGSGGFSKPRRRKGAADEPPGQLYDLQADLGETKNLYAEHPEIVEKLTKLLEQQRKAGRTAPKP